MGFKMKYIKYLLLSCALLITTSCTHYSIRELQSYDYGIQYYLITIDAMFKTPRQELIERLRHRSDDIGCDGLMAIEFMGTTMVRGICVKEK